MTRLMETLVLVMLFGGLAALPATAQPSLQAQINALQAQNNTLQADIKTLQSQIAVLQSLINGVARAFPTA